MSLFLLLSSYNTRLDTYMFAFALLYYILTYYYRMNIMNVSYEIIPPTEEDLNYNNTLQEYNNEEIWELRTQAAIERFASSDEYMEIPGFREHEDDISDDNTVLYDNEVYGFKKCGEIDGWYDYSEFNEAETILPEYDDYQLPEEEDGQMDIDDDSDYWNEMRYERMVEMEHEIDRD